MLRSVHVHLELKDSVLGGLLSVALVLEGSLDSFGPLSNGRHGGEEPTVTEGSLMYGSWSDSLRSPEGWVILNIPWTFPGSTVKGCSSIISG
jgi:hypothetical protein